MNDIETLLALEDIKRLRAKWCRFVDTAQWAEITTILMPDATLDLSGPRRQAEIDGSVDLGLIAGAPAICRWLEDNIGKAPPQLHIMTMPDIEFVSDTDAKGVWRMEAYFSVAAGRDGKCGIGYGWISDVYEKREGRWLIRAMAVDISFIA